MLITSIFVIWISFSILGYGISFAHFQRSYSSLAAKDYGSDMAMSLFFGIIGGPLFFIAFLLIEDFKGVKFK